MHGTFDRLVAAAIVAALLLAGGMASPRPTLAHPAHALPAGSRQDAAGTAGPSSLPLGWATYLGGTAYDQKEVATCRRSAGPLPPGRSSTSWSTALRRPVRD